MQKKHFWIIVISLLVFDQILKFYIKLNFYLGEEKMLLGSWFRMKFIENEGMAYGITFFEGPLAKILLTSFRLISVIVGFFI
ncbi:MAG: signal peptidase II, partial [Alphaproteobacteria bacterium]|nr:signal peptidase II [Alphaproteobacteria bacterium]